MSNYLAIATVTATLQRMLQAAIQEDVAGARVTTVRPDASGSGTPEVGVNIYLYQVTPNPAWRNVDLRTRRPKGDLVKHAQAGLDLHYLMTFYGNEVELEPQRLLGSTVRTLVDQPILTSEMIRETVNNPTFNFLEGSTLADQVERVSLVPSSLTTEDLSKIWSVLFQTAYVLSFAYQGSTVLIDGEKPGRRALPLVGRRVYVTPTQPKIEQVVSDDGANQPIVASSSLRIRGKQLRGDTTQVQIGDARITPQEVSETQIGLQLSSLLPQEASLLRAGVQGLQVVHPIPKRTQSDPDRAIESNVMPFVLCPTITAEVGVSSQEDKGDELYSADVTVQLDLMVGKRQRVFLLLNELSYDNPTAYIFASETREADTRLVVFPIRDVKGGEYLVRVQVDGAESLLSWDKNSDSPTFEQYIGPTVLIP